jgi:hypothetical protein
MLNMDLDSSVQQFVEILNGLNSYLLYFSVEFHKQFEQHQIIEILDQAKAPEWHESMVNANLDIFEISNEESIFRFHTFGELGEDQVLSRFGYTTIRKKLNCNQ